MTFLILLGAFCFLMLLLSFFAYIKCFHVPSKRKDDPFEPITGSQYDDVSDNLHRITQIMVNTPFEPVTIKSFDGLNLFGRYYRTAQDAPLQILFHGYRSHGLRDCAGGFLLARKMGFNVLVVDQRAHVKSNGRVITFGIQERKDCLSWVQYAQQRFGADTPIVLSGLSMGAATVLMASSLPLGDQTAAIMADCPYSSPMAIIRKVCQDQHISPMLASPLIRLGARVFGGFDPEEASAEEAVRGSKIPILLIHGEDDRLVPYRMSKRIYRNCASRAQLHTFPGAGHGLCYMTDPLRYERIVTEFLWSIPALQPYLAKIDYVQKELRGEIEY